MEITKEDLQTSSVQIEDAIPRESGKEKVVGTVKLIEDGELVLIPIPTADPRDPLNLPEWRKVLVVINVSIFAATATLIASSFGAILPVINKEYDNDPRVNDLVTFPALFIGLGNLLFVPVAHAIGRRPVYLFSLLMLIACCVGCACSKSLSAHIAARDLLGLAAGQAEALCPIMIQEIYFLHERGSKIAWFCAAQTLGTACLTVASSYLASSIGWRWWYGVFAIINGACLLFAVFFVTETKFLRTAAAIAGEVDADAQPSETSLQALKSRRRPAIDHVSYPGRTMAYDLALFHGKAHWQDAVSCWKQMLQVAVFPNIFWLVLCSGASLGVYVIFGAVFAGVLVQPPYNFEYQWVGFVFAGQVIVSFVVIPAQGYLSDYIVKFMSKKNGGHSEPEYRLITLILPFVVGVASTVIFGQACQHPYEWSWAAIVITFNAEFFTFVGIVVASFTYVIDSYPARSDAGLVVLCFARGAISFGMSYGSLEFVRKVGYDGACNICAGIMGALGLIGILVYYFGKDIRRLTQPWASDDQDQQGVGSDGRGD